MKKVRGRWEGRSFYTSRGNVAFAQSDFIIIGLVTTKLSCREEQSDQKCVSMDDDHHLKIGFSNEGVHHRLTTLTTRGARRGPSRIILSQLWRERFGPEIDSMPVWNDRLQVSSESEFGSCPICRSATSDSWYPSGCCCLAHWRTKEGQGGVLRWLQCLKIGACRERDHVPALRLDSRCILPFSQTSRMWI